MNNININNNKFYILIPIYNFGLFLDECIKSIISQDYNNWFCILFDDGSTDNSSIICNKYTKKYPNKFKYVKLDSKNNGPAYSKWHGIQEIKKMCNPNDMMIIIDGDDYLINNNALSIINKKYIDTNCWGTFGSYKGKFDNMKNKVNMKKYSRNNWFYMPPRTCKCFILNMFIINDFKYKNKEWLKKATDVAFFCNIIEWSGIKNIQYINNILYQYREHSNNGYKNKDTKLIEHEKYVIKLKNKNKLYYNNMFDSTKYWENRYKNKRNSGSGSYNNLAVFKSDVINNFIKDNKICKMIDYGMGDGNQLKYFKIKNYTGIDVSETIVSKCKSIYKNDKNKNFYLVEKYDKNNKQELVISLDVLLHLVYDKIYFQYLDNIFNMSSKYVIIYSYNSNYQSAEHVRYREFIPYILDKYTNWKLINHIRNKYPADLNLKYDGDKSLSDFYIFKKDN
jgi:glycosyltransferase involved in cell wall biosynthesis